VLPVILYVLIRRGALKRLAHHRRPFAMVYAVMRRSRELLSPSRVQLGFLWRGTTMACCRRSAVFSSASACCRMLWCQPVREYVMAEAASPEAEPPADRLLAVLVVDPRPCFFATRGRLILTHVFG
jgi:hypothetical protein